MKVKTNKNYKIERFTPGPQDRLWIYKKHYANLQRALYGHGSRDEIIEAVCGAIAKCLGDHPNLHLDKPLENVTEEELFWSIYHQARAILSHEHEHQKRFAPNKYHTFSELQKVMDDTINDITLSEEKRTITLRNLKRLMNIMEMVSVGDKGGNIRISHLDREIVRAELFHIMNDLFRKHHIKASRAKAFIDAFFTNKSSRNRAAENGMTVNDIDTSKNQLLKLLNKNRNVFRESQILSDYFQSIMVA